MVYSDNGSIVIKCEETIISIFISGKTPPLSCQPLGQLLIHGKRWSYLSMFPALLMMNIIDGVLSQVLCSACTEIQIMEKYLVGNKSTDKSFFL